MKDLNTIQQSMLEGEVIESMRQVFDPELPINIYDLGLIYEVNVDDNANVHVVMTLTSPMCPVAEVLPGEVEEAVRATPGVASARVELTWDPPFSIELMSEEARLTLGLI